MMDGQENNMNGSWFFDKNFNGVPDDFFDDALKYFDLPMEDVESNEAIEDWESQFQHLPTPSNLLSDFTSGICHHISKDNLKLKNSSILSDESSQPKPWLGAAEASSGRRITLNYDTSDGKYPHPFRTTSPVSVLESSSSTSSAENSTVYQPKFAIPAKRPRSKYSRARRQEFSLYAPKIHPWVDSTESDPDEKTLDLGKKKQKKKNLMLLSCNVEKRKPSEVQGQIRKCTHCEVTKTPQWREGPMGPKTLCNACGVRYRSGRLFPEYRPAASPTFVPTLHSNSHRKVIEMRKNHRHVGMMAAMNTALSPVPEYSF